SSDDDDDDGNWLQPTEIPSNCAIFAALPSPSPSSCTSSKFHGCTWYDCSVALVFISSLFFLLSFCFTRNLFRIMGEYCIFVDLNHEKQNSKDAMEVKQFSISDEAIEVVKKRGGGAVAGAHGGGEHGNAGNGGGDNGRGSGGQIPVYAAGAGAGNHNRDHLHHGSTSGPVNYIGTSCLPLLLFMFFFYLFVVCNMYLVRLVLLLLQIQKDMGLSVLKQIYSLV
ncbi:hypothetical protein Gohar_025601, partial [Gossypium harknessii]|nr:hypothetical protein [Gossypium harknessii]